MELVEEMQAQTSREEGEGQQRRIGLWIALVPIVLLLYVLSVGPVLRVYPRALIRSRAVRGFYYPLVAVSQHSRPCARVLDWYVRLWKPGE